MMASGVVLVGNAGLLTNANGPIAWLVLAAAVVAMIPAGMRWLRVSQREHYLPGAPIRFALRWWSSEPVNLVLAAVAAAGVGLAVRWPVAGFVSVLVVAGAPVHLSVRGRTSPLRPTRRLRTLAAVSGALAAALVVLGALIGAPAPVTAGTALLLPVLVDAASRILAPIERRAIQPFIRTASARLADVAPTIVGITGSYGKTSTKQHLAYLLDGFRRVVASPASFNNRAGLSRTVNEHLVEGTEVFIAEMGTYSPGEIAELCRWCPPKIAVITAIGPVHLERFGSEERVLAAKEEILGPASVVVLNTDDPRLAALARHIALQGSGPRVISCSGTGELADVCVRREGSSMALFVAGECVAAGMDVPAGVQPTNLACAAAVALELGVDPADLARRLRTIPSVANRLAQGTAASGVLVVDDTFNSNPAGARAALEVLAASAPSGRRVVVTPGIVELGPLQAEENRKLGAGATRVASDLVVVGRTNRRALTAGAGGKVITVRNRERAVAWVRAHLGPGDAVLYENDLPDHYP
jgi:UDP-N-acetylmuramoyl-tripeptide--D-alanyl-D-alanine ligase